MPTVGFEPTRANTADLKSAPLDQLGHVGSSKFYLLETGSLTLGTTPTLSRAATGIEPASRAKKAKLILL